MASNSSTTTNGSPIKTVVVLVQENRSFDHMLGWMKSLNPEINGVTGSESNPVSTSDPNSNRVQFSDKSVYVDPDPGHSIQDIYEQIFGEPWSEASAAKNLPPNMQGFAQNATRKEISKNATTTMTMTETVMNGFKPDLVPVYKELVKEFAVCDRWFASVPASTQPNRLYVHSATSHGLTSNDTNKLIGGLPQKTIFDSLDENGFSFGIYYQSPPATLFYRNLRKLKYIDNFLPFDLFRKHCKEGKLPNYVVLEQRFFDLLSIPGNDDHPSHDVSEGQKFVKEVYEALRSSPQWNETLFVIIYDEHGGFYDHVPTPVEGVPSPDGIVGPKPFMFRFDRLGVRIPAIIVSPWIEPGTVLHEPSGPSPTSQYEHSSIPATVKKIFNLPEFLTKRDEWAGTFEGLLTRSSPRTDCPEKLPDPIKLREGAAQEKVKLSEFQEELVQMAATLNGDHKKSIYPDKLIENMTVSEAVKYVEEAFNTFLNECEKAKKSGADESEIVDCANGCSTPPSSKNFFHNVLSCITCNR
ncbi:non-specific phospholipase C4 [Cajanus cajan]|uniref:Non-hemolytic phospholipase C n=1 Tax=Cajanus cajan TaxID=3821 RepID=A0A151RAW7_CAJCA|nr:non-specific phospholipase C4 [Cajanus cajan]KYP39639.1 Non-hemolytic phospholipase C [Cajanus cajan]